MCLMVYLGTDAPVPGFGAREVALGEVGLDAEVAVRPGALAGKAHLWRVADRLERGWNCSCIFLDSGLPEDMQEQVDPDARKARIRAFAGLRKVAEAALAVDPEAVLFSCWSTEENAPLRVTRHVSVAGLQADAGLFDDIDDGGPGANPPVLIRLEAVGP